MKKVYNFGTALFLSVLFLTPSFAHAAGGGLCDLSNEDLNGVVGCITGIMENIIVLLIAGAVLYIVYGAFEMIRSEEKRESGRQTIIYGVIGLFVMVSVWGLVNILDKTFNLRGSYIPAPQITPNSGASKNFQISTSNKPI